MKNCGPQNIIIPEIRFQACNGCKHFERRLVKSGKNPLYTNICHFSFSIETINNKMPFYITDYLESANKNGAVIYSNDNLYCHCPDWCPYNN